MQACRGITHRASLVQLSPHGLVQILPEILPMHVCLKRDACRAKLIQRVGNLLQGGVHVWDGQRSKKSESAGILLNRLGSELIHLSGQECSLWAGTFELTCRMASNASMELAHLAGGG